MAYSARRLILRSGISISVLMVTGVICISCYTGTNLFKPGPIKSVTPEAWARLRIGMSKEEVIRLFGNSPSKSGPAAWEICYQKTNFPEFWEYNWSDGLDFISPSDKAYVVYFDSSNQVSRFRAPLTGVAASATNQSSVPPLDLLPMPGPEQADLVALCTVRVESNRVRYTTSEVWKGQKYLPNDFKARPGGLVLINEKEEPGTGYGNLALVWYKGKPGTTNFFADNPCRSWAFVEDGRIALPSLGNQSSSVSLDELRRCGVVGVVRHCHGPRRSC